MVRRGGGAAAVVFAVAAAACHLRAFTAPDVDAGSCNPTAQDGTTRPSAMMDFGALGADFFAAPFPARGRVPGGGVDGDRFPASTPIMWHLRSLVPGDGYAVSGGIFFQLTGAVLPGSLPPRFAVPSPAASVVLFPLGAPGELAPINVDVASSTFPAPDLTPKRETLLSILPVQGRPLRENTDYVALVTTDVASPPPQMQALCASSGVAGLDASDAALYAAAIADAATMGIGCDRIGALSVFHTADPTAELHAAALLARGDFLAHQRSCRVRLHREKDSSYPGPRCPSAPFCVYSGTVELPQYQQGTPPFFPYFDWHGGWPPPPVPAPKGGPAPSCADPAQAPSPPGPWVPTWRSARIVVTIPQAPPATGSQGTPQYPTLALVRTGAGSSTDPLVDRGPILDPTCTPTACRGPAEVLQSVGFAGITIDGPLVGTSRTEPIELNEDVAIFDFLNPEALRDNIRQSAVELDLLPDVADLVDLDLSECPGAGSGVVAPLDTGRLALFAHSMGATIAPLALAGEPRYRAAILSGSGGSLIENVLYKTQPVPVNAAASLLGFSCVPQDRDPQLSLLQWALEPADSQVYARRVVADTAPPGSTWSVASARHVLMIQGIVDHYILPPIADVMTLGEGLDLAYGPASCNDDPRCDKQPVYGSVASPDYPSIADLLPLSGRSALPLPVSGNVTAGGATLTAAVVQHRIDQNREDLGAGCAVDGHEVIYESKLARHQYACFLDDFAKGKTPTIRTSGDVFTPCN
jgi:hypothetical protein